MHLDERKVGAADIQSMVANAVGLDPARGDTIAVTTPAFLMSTTKAAKAAGTPGGGPVDMLASYGPKALGALLLLLVGVGFLRTVKNGTSTEVPEAQLTAAVEAGRRTALPSGSQVAIPAQRTSSEDLLGVIDDRPDEVTGLLRGWLENTGAGR